VHRPLVHRSSAWRHFRTLPPIFFTSPSLLILALLFPCNSALFDLLGPFDLLVPFGLLTVPAFATQSFFSSVPFLPVYSSSLISHRGSHRGEGSPFRQLPSGSSLQADWGPSERVGLALLVGYWLVGCWRSVGLCCPMDVARWRIGCRRLRQPMFAAANVCGGQRLKAD
jgi:hypothetical protein